MKRILFWALVPAACASTAPAAAQDVWEEVPELPEGLQDIYATPHDGQLWLVGGMDRGGAPTSRFLRMPEPRGEHVSAAAGERIFVIGGRVPMMPGAVGFANLRDSATALVYDPPSDSWEHIASHSVASNSAAAAVIDGKIYVVGGRSYCELDDGSWQNVNSRVLEVYNPAGDNWQTLAAMPNAQGGLAAASFGCKLHVFGGEQWIPELEVFPDVWVYDPDANEWAPTTSMPTPRNGLAAVALTDRIFVFGGAAKAGADAVAINEALRVQR